jgi:exodeoxyribonuclease-3
VLIATWNVNSLKIRLPQLLDWLAAHPIDIVCLQETTLTDERFPAQALADAGYAAVYAGQPAYNGVAILARRDTVGEPADVQVGNPLYPDEQRRLISATVAGVRVVCAYVPNGQAVDSDKYRYKLAWLDHLVEWLTPQLAAGAPIALAGDYNIAPEARDVRYPENWEGQVLCSAPERERFARLIEAGLVDTFRLFEQPEKTFTWWDYRQMAFRRNDGLRIDHVLIASTLKARVSGCRVERAMRAREQPSDHAPVIVELSGPG